MKSNYEYLDKIILFISCTFIYLSFYNNSLNVVPILIALTLACFLFIFENKTLLRIGIYLLYIGLAMFNLDYVYFIPLIVYDLLIESYKPLYLLPLIPLSRFMIQYSLHKSLIIVVVFVIAVFIRFKSTDIVGYKSKYYQLMDDTKELTLRLNQQNQNLLEKQDNDIFIATLNERNRIAREIHDHVGHQLSSAILQLGALMAICKDDITKANLIPLKKTLDLGMDQIRQSVHNLYDTSIDLNETLLEITNNFTFCEIKYENSIQLKPSQKQCYAIIAIVKEALSNIMKHSNATEVTLQLREHPSLYQLIIHDNGDPTTFVEDEGIGLKNMAQRVDFFKGHFQIKCTQGFEIFISLPKEDQATHQS